VGSEWNLTRRFRCGTGWVQPVAHERHETDGAGFFLIWIFLSASDIFSETFWRCGDGLGGPCYFRLKAGLQTLFFYGEELFHGGDVEGAVGDGGGGADGGFYVHAAEDLLFSSGGEDAELAFAGASVDFAVGEHR